MPPLKYHFGQLALQTEAKTSLVAGQLAHWVGPVADFARGADLILLASTSAGTELQFTLLSGKPPLVEPLDRLGSLRLRFPEELAEQLPPATVYGGLAISLSNARRARINGNLVRKAGVTELESSENFTSCKKYIAPSLALDDQRHIGPVSREPLALDDPWLAGLLVKAETAFFASLSPDLRPDVAHRGGPQGFLQLNAAARRLTWNEYVGDGVFKSAGNLRATHTMTLLVPDFATGDGVELIGRGDYKNLREDRQQRMDALVHHHEEYPVQGVITCEIDRAVRLRGLLHPRSRLERILKVTSRSSVAEQAPQ